MAASVGIDFGTRNSAIAVLDHGRPRILPNSEGKLTTPSVVAVTRDGGLLVGQQALERAAADPTRSVQAVKQLLGTDRSFTVDGGTWAPQQTAAQILKKLRRDAERQLGHQVTDVVVSVPVYFDGAQRQALREAGSIAGLNVLRLVNAPTASAIAYSLENDSSERILLVADLGAGGLDVAVVELGLGVVEVKAAAGSVQGGDAWTRALVDYLKSPGDQVSALWPRAEDAKVRLSAEKNATVRLLHANQMRVRRSDFERVTAPLLDDCAATVQRALTDAGVTTRDVSDFVLLGGASAMPAVRDRLARLAGRRPAAHAVTVVAGAAIEAGILQGEVKDLLPLDVTTMSIGIETKGGVFTKLIDRNTTIPAKRTETFTTADDNQPSVQISLFQGERPMAENNRPLGTFELRDLPPAPRGVPEIDVTFEIDANGLLHVDARDRASGRAQAVSMTGGPALSPAVLDRMRREAMDGGTAEEDRRRLDEAELRNATDNLLARTERFLAEFGDRVPDQLRRDAYASMADARSACAGADIERVRRAHDALSTAAQRAGAALHDTPAAPPEQSADIEATVTVSFEDASAGTILPFTMELDGAVQTIQVRIPAGVRDGMRLRIPLQRAQGGYLYLRLSVAGPVSPYEAKVVLVGEGTVGKTSLVASLRGQEFQHRSRTHGVEVHTLTLPHPESQVDMTLRLWDFGGQRVYRMTHQFFYSQRALYLLVWNARAGQEKDDVIGWLRQLRARLGDTARVMLVATHCDEARPDVDFAGLQRAFPGLLVGLYGVDNRSGTGIVALRAAISQQVATLPHEQPLSGGAVAARDEILARAAREPQISYGELVAVCGRYGLSEADAEALAARLHSLGQIVFHGDDEALRDLVILNPEWLSKAIGYVLEDDATAAARGVLDHARLPEIWRPRPGEPPYARHHYPYFLRLMEKFEVSFRLDDGQHSLVAQLVPTQQPELPWQADSPLLPTERRLRLVCQLNEPVPGLLAALTVRLSYADAALHWRTGVFLRHPNPAYASAAVIELREPNRLTVEVRAPSPDMFFHVLRDSVEHLIRRRWPGLRYEQFVPCPTERGAAGPCPGQFRLDGLMAARQRRPTVTCPECFADHDIALLLTGFPPAAATSASSVRGVTEELRHLRAGLARIGEGVQGLQADAADNAYAMRRVLAFVGTEITDCPRLFTLTRAESTGLARVKVHQEHYRLTLWCEHPDCWHPWPDAAYAIDRPKEWLVQISRYAGPVLAVLRRAVPLAGAFAALTLSPDQLQRANKELGLMQELMNSVPALPVTDGPPGADGSADEPTRAGGAELRGVRELLFEIDRYRQFGGLNRVQAPSGEFLWVCAEHVKHYDPGLPTL